MDLQGKSTCGIIFYLHNCNAQENLTVMNTVQIRGLQASSNAPGSNEGKISARDGSSTALLWQYGVGNDKPVPALLRKSYNSGVDTALSSAHQLIQGSSQGECSKWAANGSRAEPDEGVIDKQPPEHRHGQEKARVRRKGLMLTQSLHPIRGLQGMKAPLPRSTFSSISYAAPSNARKNIIYLYIWEGTTS